MARRPADPEEELRWMSQEVRGYVEAVLNSLAANVPKVSSFLNFANLIFSVGYLIDLIFLSMVEQAVVLCQVEKAKEDMLNQLYSSVRLMAFLFLSYQLMIILFVVIVHGFNIW